MRGFVDVHTHILPGVDDGAVDLQQALVGAPLAWCWEWPAAGISLTVLSLRLIRLQQ